jgi:RluA family pseudouridine synthase
VGLDPALRETASVLCFNCRAPLTEEEQQDPRYQPPRACPYCFKSGEQKTSELLAERHEALARVSHPLPGSQPYDNKRPFLVPPELDGQTLLDCLCRAFPRTPRGEWQARCEDGFFLDEAGEALSAAARVQAGQRVTQLFPGITEPDVNPDIRVLHEDEALAILAKPAPLPMHPSGRFNRNSLEYLLDRAFKPLRLRPAHRLDANTTGLVVCGKNRRMAAALQPQFERGEVEKTYLARVQGSPPWEAFTCEAPISANPGQTGTRTVDFGHGLAARTDFRILSRRASDGTTLLEARPRTGRTNQIRVHLWHLGYPVCGDPAYLPGGRIGEIQTLPVGAPPLCLHHWRVAFRHPIQESRAAFEAPLPCWAQP